jgi:hypothetical protein
MKGENRSMSDFDPIASLNDYYQERERKQAEAREVMAGACAALAKLGVNIIRIYYDGSCDSGTIEGVEATGEAGKIELPGEIRDQLIAATPPLLPSGWEFEGGSFGELVIDVTNRRLKREHNWHIDTTEYEEEVWEL